MSKVLLSFHIAIQSSGVHLRPWASTAHSFPLWFQHSNQYLSCLFNKLWTAFTLWVILKWPWYGNFDIIHLLLWSFLPILHIFFNIVDFLLSFSKSWLLVYIFFMLYIFSKHVLLGSGLFSVHFLVLFVLPRTVFWVVLHLRSVWWSHKVFLQRFP